MISDFMEVRKLERFHKTSLTESKMQKFVRYIVFARKRQRLKEVEFS
jgi:hypothetical protein